MLAGSAIECAENGPTGPVGGHQVPWFGMFWIRIKIGEGVGSLER